MCEDMDSQGVRGISGRKTRETRGINLDSLALEMLYILSPDAGHVYLSRAIIASVEHQRNNHTRDYR